MTATIRSTGVDAGIGDLAVVLTPEPDGRPRRRPGRHLRPVEKQTKRRSPAVPVIVGSGIVIVALFALAAMHALLISGQLHLDDLRREQASESEEIRRLRLEVAQLEAPDRVLEVARDRLGMVDPGEVGYLLPVGVAGGDDAPVRVDPATTPPPVEETVSPEQAEVDADADAATRAADPNTDTDGATTPATPSEGAADGGAE